MMPTEAIEQNKAKIIQLETEIKQMENIKGSPVEQWHTMVQTPAAKTDFALNLAKTFFPWGEKFEINFETLFITASNHIIKVPLHNRNRVIVVSYNNVRPVNPYNMDKNNQNIKKFKKISTCIEMKNFSAARKLIFENQNTISAFFTWLVMPFEYKTSKYWRQRISEMEAFQKDVFEVNMKYKAIQERDAKYFKKTIYPHLKEFAKDIYYIEFA